MLTIPECYLFYAPTQMRIMRIKNHS